MNAAVSYIPIATTLFAAFFFTQIYAHYRRRRTPYLLWWSLGVLTFGLGTLTESIHALSGWHALNLRFWYVAGALLGAFPLAQGSVYLLMKKRFAEVTSILFTALITVAAVCVFLTPIILPPGFDGRLSGKVFAWRWVRFFSPFINTYAFIFLVGGAVYSALRYYRRGDRRASFKGNILIAIGGLLPGIGGTATRLGHVEWLFVTELIGLILIYAGYRIVRGDKRRVAA